MAFNWNRQGTGAAVDPAAAVAPGSSAPPEGLTEEQRTQLASLLVGFYTFLKTNAPSHFGLSSAVAELHTAVAAYQSGQSEDPFGPVRSVLAAVETARRSDRGIPQP